nr:probable beta-D-xylosidase 7 [Ipomoea batatas]
MLLRSAAVLLQPFRPTNQNIGLLPSGSLHPPSRKRSRLLPHARREDLLACERRPRHSLLRHSRIELVVGVANVGKCISLSGPISAATSFPQVILTAASFNEYLLYRIDQSIYRSNSGLISISC